MKLELNNQNPDQNSSLKVKVVFTDEDLKQEATPYGMVFNLKGGNIEGDIGAPALPSKVLQVALPPFTHPKNVSANIINTKVISKVPILVASIQETRAGVKEKRPDDKVFKGRQPDPKQEQAEECSEAPLTNIKLTSVRQQDEGGNSKAREIIQSGMNAILGLCLLLISSPAAVSGTADIPAGSGQIQAPESYTDRLREQEAARTPPGPSMLDVTERRSEMNRHACNEWCDSNNDECKMCRPSGLCGDGYVVLRTWGGSGTAWDACKFVAHMPGNKERIPGRPQPPGGPRVPVPPVLK